VIYFDELHKHKDWKTLLRNYQSQLTEESRIIVTGSARMEIHKIGGASLKGISILYHVFPITAAEIIRNSPVEIGINEPLKIDNEQWQALVRFGGFPDPYLNANDKFYNRWSKDKDHQLFEEDLRDPMDLITVKNIEKLTHHLKNSVKHQVKYNTLADYLNVKESDIKTWITLLENHYYCFTVNQWHRSPSMGLTKNPKIYLWDWSELSDRGARYENLVAVHLKKAIYFWNDNGGKYALYFLHSSKNGEVDFLVTEDGAPWLMVEVKSSKEGIQSSLNHFSDRLVNVPHILQVTADMPYVDIDCFSLKKKTVVPMVTFLSQLV